MNVKINYKNNPLHGLSLKNLLKELIDHYGFEILYAYLHINCFKTNPSIESSVKFLKKTDWAREKVESFYLYSFKSLPRASEDQFQLSPRDRIVPEDQSPGEPAELSLQDAERLREKRAKKAGAHGSNSNRNDRSQKSDHSSDARKENRSPTSSSGAIVNTDSDPWAKSRAMIRDRKKT